MNWSYGRSSLNALTTQSRYRYAFGIRVVAAAVRIEAPRIVLAIARNVEPHPAPRARRSAAMRAADRRPSQTRRLTSRARRPGSPRTSAAGPSDPSSRGGSASRLSADLTGARPSFRAAPARTCRCRSAPTDRRSRESAGQIAEAGTTRTPSAAAVMILSGALAAASVAVVDDAGQGAPMLIH